MPITSEKDDATSMGALIRDYREFEEVLGKLGDQWIQDAAILDSYEWRFYPADKPRFAAVVDELRWREHFAGNHLLAVTEPEHDNPEAHFKVAPIEVFHAAARLRRLVVGDPKDRGNELIVSHPLLAGLLLRPSEECWAEREAIERAEAGNAATAS